MQSVVIQNCPVLFPFRFRQVFFCCRLLHKARWQRAVLTDFSNKCACWSYVAADGQLPSPRGGVGGWVGVGGAALSPASCLRGTSLPVDRVSAYQNVIFPRGLRCKHVVLVVDLLALWREICTLRTGTLQGQGSVVDPTGMQRGNESGCVFFAHTRI